LKKVKKSNKNRKRFFCKLHQNIFHFSSNEKKAFERESKKMQKKFFFLVCRIFDMYVLCGKGNLNPDGTGPDGTGPDKRGPDKTGPDKLGSGEPKLILVTFWRLIRQ
jgi:hypothetical protein